MKILIIIPQFISYPNDFYDLPLGIAYISSTLKADGHDVRAINMNRHVDEDPVPIFQEYFSNNEVELVMTGGLSACFHSIEKIMKAVRHVAPDLPLILGGGIVTSDKEVICKELKPDYAVLAEAEETIKELVHKLDQKEPVHDVLGIGYPDGDDFIFTLGRPAIADIDSLPDPDYEIFDLEDYFSRQSPLSNNFLWSRDFPRILPIVTSRSCPLKCTFCFHPVGQKYRMRSLDRVFEEIENLIEKYDINMICILDEMMSASKKRLIDFAERMKKYDIMWNCQLWPGTVDAETMQVMKDSGCYVISYGLESINDDVLKSMQKHGVTRAKIEKQLEEAVEFGVAIQGNFIFGDPAETYETSEETLAWWRDHPDYHINVGHVIPYPGTPLYRQAVMNGTIDDPAKYIRSGFPWVNMTQMSDQQYDDLSQRMSKYTAEARQFAKVISVKKDTRTEGETLIADIECPHCKETVTYGNLVIPRLEMLKLGCRNCRHRFDLNPSSFPPFSEALEKEQIKIKTLHEKNGQIVITPRFLEHHFLDYFQMLGLNYEELNISAILDNNADLCDKKYLEEFDVMLRSPENIEKFKDAGFIVMNSVHKEAIVQSLLENGIPADSITTIN